jgi:hypothetical protein
MISEQERKIDVALVALMKTCGFTGESGTEAMFWILHEAVQDVASNWHIVDLAFST